MEDISYTQNQGRYISGHSKHATEEGKPKYIWLKKQVKAKYKDKGFAITDFHGDNIFKHFQDFFAPAYLHTWAKNDHIGDIEQYIQTIKEFVRCGCQSMLYRNTQN